MKNVTKRLLAGTLGIALWLCAVHAIAQGETVGDAAASPVVEEPGISLVEPGVVTLCAQTPAPTVEVVIVTQNAEHSAEPTVDPTLEPAGETTTQPMADPTAEPTQEATTLPTIDPTLEPTMEPTMEPTSTPTQIPATEPVALAQREVFISCEMQSVMAEGDTFLLKAVLTGFEGTAVDLQWQYNNGKDDNGDGQPDGWQNAGGNSKALVCEIPANEENLNSQWHLLITILG